MRNDPGKIGMRPLSVCVFFLTLAGSCENHGFGSNANTFIFQVGHPSMCACVCMCMYVCDHVCSLGKRDLVCGRDMVEHPI